MQQREKRQGLLPAPAAWGSGFQLAQAIGQQPQGAVQAQALVDALHRAGLLAVAVTVAAMQPAFDEVFLRLCGASIYVEQQRSMAFEGAEYLLPLHINFTVFAATA